MLMRMQMIGRRGTNGQINPERKKKSNISHQLTKLLDWYGTVVANESRTLQHKPHRKAWVERASHGYVGMLGTTIRHLLGGPRYLW